MNTAKRQARSLTLVNPGCMLFACSLWAFTMAIDLSTLKKLETLPASLQVKERGKDDRVVVLVKIHEGAQKPSYVEVRTRISQEIFSTELGSEDLLKLEKDPAVESFSVSRALPMMK